MTPKQVIGLVLVALAAVATFVLPRTDLAPGPDPTGPTHGCERAHDADERATLCLLNAERAERDLAPLRRRPVLDRAAEAHARDMAGHGYFAHQAPDGTGPHERILRAGYRRARLTGENLAKGEREAGVASSIVDGWMHSPGHRANILRPGFEEIGVAVVEDGAEAIYVTTFGARR
ncbi:MAG TPA: CAP domain-containing protein [Solirubrobacteraceae bacterium]